MDWKRIHLPTVVLAAAVALGLLIAYQLVAAKLANRQ